MWKPRLKGLQAAFALGFIAVSAMPCYADNLSMDKLKGIDSEALSSPELSSYASLSDSEEDHRIKAVRNAAKMVGAQHGYNEHYNALQNHLRERSEYLDKIWDFRTLMTLSSGSQNGKYLIPAILSEAKGVAAVSSDLKTITIAERKYSILRPARLTLNAPHWKSYLLSSSDMETNLPSKLLLPKNKEEREIWENAIEEGWENGKQLAEREMISRMRRMKQDFNGILNNLELSMKGKLDKTVVSYDFQMSAGGGDDLTEKRHVYRIAAPARLKGDISEWKPIIMDTQDSLSFPMESGVYVDPLGKVK